MNEKMPMGGGLQNLLNKDIKELNGIILSLFCVSILVISGIVSYKVTNSYALFSDSIKGSKVIALEVVPKPTAVITLVSKVGETGLEEVTHVADSTLQIGSTETITEYRYRGGNDVVTNNYVYFNCSNINNQTASTCELYRIIGVFPTDDGTGNIENRIKLIKAENYGNNYWDYQSSSSGSNNWARPATLNIMLNETYWSTINSDYQNLIEDVKYYLGGNTTTIVNTNVMYQYERKIDETDGGNYYYVGNPISWIGKLALMYASDYGYAANSECSDSTTLSNYETNSCPDNNWLYFGKDEWLLPQYSPRNDYSFIIYPSGFVNTTVPTSSVINSYAVRPVFYLTVDAEFVGGTGTSDDPYRLL